MFISPRAQSEFSPCLRRFIRVWGMHSDGATHRNALTRLAPSLSFQAATRRYTVKLEGLLTGHEDWVHFVQFHSGNEI